MGGGTCHQLVIAHAIRSKSNKRLFTNLLTLLLDGYWWASCFEAKFNHGWRLEALGALNALLIPRPVLLRPQRNNCGSVTSSNRWRGDNGNGAPITLAFEALIRRVSEVKRDKDKKQSIILFGGTEEACLTTHSTEFPIHTDSTVAS